jgi:hypothetical protein
MAVRQATDRYLVEFGKDAKNDQYEIMSPYSHPSLNQLDNGRGNPIDEIISNMQKFVQLRTSMNQLQNNTIPFYPPPIYAPMNSRKAVGFRCVSCDTCLSSILDPVFSFDRFDSPVKAGPQQDNRYFRL